MRISYIEDTNKITAFLDVKYKTSRSLQTNSNILILRLLPSLKCQSYASELNAPRYLVS